MTRTITCEDCGVCCWNQSSPPFMQDDFEKLPPELQAEIDAYVMGTNFNDALPCMWLQDGRCKHYDLRPDVCRDFQVGCQSCRKMRRERGIK